MWIPLKSAYMNPQNFFSEVKPGQVVSVSWLNRAARETLERSFPLLWVGGEVSTLTRASSGHVYFTLKDDQAQIRCTMWRSKAQLLPFKLEHGMQVEVRGLVGLYEARGDYQLNVESIRQAGVGNLFEAFLRLKARLQAEGVFDAALKRPLPRYPRALAVITSAQAAAWHDVQAALARRAPHLPIHLYPALVQGPQAPARLIAALNQAGQDAARLGHEVILLVRGGGSLEDLAAFNDEALARAIRACPLPVVVGVGHESDVSIADFAADLRAATPTAAAELVSAGFAELHERLDQLEFRLQRAMQRRVEHAAQRVDRAALRLQHPRARLQQAGERLERLAQRLRQYPARSLERQKNRLATLALRLANRRPDIPQARHRLADLERRLTRAGQQRVQQHRQHLDALAQHLAHLDPKGVLARGYSITRDAQGQIVRDIQQLAPGARVALEFHQGRAEARIEALHPDTPKQDSLKP